MIVAFALCLAGASAALGQARQAEVLGIEQLRSLSANRPARTSSLRLSYDSFQEPSALSAGRHIPHMFRSVLVDASTGRFSMDRSMELEDGEHDFGTQTVTITFDGEVQGAFAPDSMIGVVQEGTDVDGLTESGLWTVMLLGDPQPDGLGIDDRSLESLLAHGAVRDQLEPVADRSCHVVDAFYEGTRYATIWLDVDRGLLPMKFVGYGGDGNASTTTTVDSVAYLEDEGVWLPQSWRTEIQARGETLRSQTIVEPESVQLDPPVVDADFWPYFPPGTTVTDLIAGQTYRIAESGEIGEILYEQGSDGEWRRVAPEPAATDAATEHAAPPDPPAADSSPAAPIVASLKKLMEFAPRETQASQPDRGQRDLAGDATAPTSATELDAPNSKAAAPPEPASPAPADVKAVERFREPEPSQPAEPGVAADGSAPQPRPAWPWIVGVTAIAALLAVGYYLWRRNPA